MWVFIPAILVCVIGVVLLDGYMVLRLTRSVRTPMYSTPHDLQVIMQKPMWTDDKWRDLDGSQSVGWFLSRGKPAPTIIVSHGYGENRSEFLTLAFELWKAGYNVLLYDLRGHGESTVDWSGLGMFEKDDLVSAINYLQNIKGADGKPASDGRIGLYGVEMGAYSSILASSQNTQVKALALDSVYPDIASYVKYRLKAGVGSGNLWAKLIDYPTTGKLTDIGLQMYLKRRNDSETAAQVLSSPTDHKFLFIVGADSGPLGDMTKALYDGAQGQKEFVQLTKSRLDRLYENDCAEYDARVVAFFKQAMPATGVPPEAPAQRASR